MTREEELKLQEDFLKSHSHKISKKPVHFVPLPAKRKNGKKSKHRHKKINKEYLKALRRNKRGLVTKITKTESVFKELLDALEIDYNFQRIFTVDGKGYIVDFYLKDYLTVVEIDGNNHTEKEQDKKDHKRTEALLKLERIIHIIRFDNDEVLAMSIDDLKKILAIRLCPFIEGLL